MGSDDGQDDERPRHLVEVSAFECAIYPVTEEQYAEFLDATDHETPREWKPSMRALPVTGVSWYDASDFCAWRSANGEPMRLPTEAEWEWAARGGLENSRFPWGDEIPSWIPSGGCGPLEGPWPVTVGEPNGFGIYGIAANIHEWCSDWHSATFYAESPLRDPRGPERGVRKASRGGAWRHAVTISRCAQRSKISPSFRYTDYGFRVVRDLRSERRLDD